MSYPKARSRKSELMDDGNPTGGTFLAWAVLDKPVFTARRRLEQGERERLASLTAISPRDRYKLCHLLLDDGGERGRKVRNDSALKSRTILEGWWNPVLHPRGRYQENRGWFSPSEPADGIDRDRIRRDVTPDPLSLAHGNSSLSRYTRTAPRALADSGSPSAPRVALNADGSASNMSPQIDERVLNQLQRGNSGQRPIESTIHRPRDSKPRGRESLEPLGAQEILNASSLEDANGRQSGWESEVKAAFRLHKSGENAVVSAAEESCLLGVLRDMYREGDRLLGERARALVTLGMSPEDAARWRVDATNALKKDMRSRGNAFVENWANLRESTKRNPSIPSFDELMMKHRTGGLSDLEAYHRIINRKPDVGANKLALKLKIAGTLMIGLDIGLAGYRIIEAPTWQQSLRDFAKEAARIGGAAAGAWAGARVGTKIGARGGAYGAGTGGLVGAFAGGIAGGAAAEVTIRNLAYKMFPPSKVELDIRRETN